MSPSTQAALDAVPAIKQHLDKVRRGARIDEAELRVFMSAAELVAHNPVASALVGSHLLDMLMSDYQAQVNAEAQRRLGR